MKTYPFTTRGQAILYRRARFGRNCRHRGLRGSVRRALSALLGILGASSAAFLVAFLLGPLLGWGLVPIPAACAALAVARLAALI